MRHHCGKSLPLTLRLPPVSEHGFIGYSSWLLGSNAMPDYTLGENFFTVFGVFFPAATGDLVHLCSSVDKVKVLTS